MRKRIAAPTRASSTRTSVPGATRRQQILAAAAGLFAQRGFAGTTTKQIATAAGTSETVLFRHFPTKESLYAAILEYRVPVEEVERWLEELRKIGDRRDDEALVAAVVRAVLRSYRTDAAFHRLMLFAALEDHELARLNQIKYTSPVTSFLREYVSRRQSEGAFARLQPELIVHMLFSIVGHYALWNALGINPLGLTEQDVMTQAIAMIRGLRADAARPAKRRTTTQTSKRARASKR